MQQSSLRRLAMFGVTGLALSSVSVGVSAITADNVICAGCVSSSDIANYSIFGVDINPDTLLGNSVGGGRLAIRTTANPAALVFEASGKAALGPPIVRIGRGGTAPLNVATDLVVVDPLFTASSTEPVMRLDALGGALYLGSGNGTNAGQSGELFIQNGLGTTNVWLFGTGQAYLGNSGTAGYLALDDGTAHWTSINLYGSTGDVVNQFNGNGLVKAWARMNGDGTVASCYRCSTSIVDTQRFSPGVYEVDFTPVGTDISGRPWTCSMGTGAVFGGYGMVGCVQRSGDPSSLFVETTNTAGVLTDQAYTIVVY